LFNVFHPFYPFHLIKSERVNRGKSALSFMLFFT
jgi:hypothetical protein